jgi:hypothetical protein
MSKEKLEIEDIKSLKKMVNFFRYTIKPREEKRTTKILGAYDTVLDPEESLEKECGNSLDKTILASFIFDSMFPQYKLNTKTKLRNNEYTAYLVCLKLQDKLISTYSWLSYKTDMRTFALETHLHMQPRQFEFAKGEKEMVDWYVNEISKPCMFVDTVSVYRYNPLNKGNQTIEEFIDQVSGENLVKRYQFAKKRQISPILI